MTGITDAIELLTRQHAELDQLLLRLPLVDGSERAVLLGTLADKLTTHLAIEAEVFYPVVAELVPLEELLAEHAEITRVIAELMTRADRANDLVSELGTLLHGHTCWQEDELFGRVLDSMEPEALAFLGLQLDVRSQASLCLAA